MEENIHISDAQKKLIVMEGNKKVINRILGILLLVIPVFLFLRIILRAFDASATSLFAGFVYLVSGVFLIPFFGIFPQSDDGIIPNGAAFDGQATIAIFCYVVLILLTMGVIQIATKIFKTGKQVDATVEKSHPVDTNVVANAIE